MSHADTIRAHREWEDDANSSFELLPDDPGQADELLKLRRSRDAWRRAYLTLLAKVQQLGLVQQHLDALRDPS